MEIHFCVNIVFFTHEWNDHVEECIENVNGVRTLNTLITS